MKHNEMKRIIKKHYEKRKPVLIFGSTGIGKSQLVRQAAFELAKEQRLRYSEDWGDMNKTECLCLLDIRASDLDRTDIAGYPVPDHETKSMKFYGFEGFPRAGRGIIFVDEINLAPASVQKALYALILDRKLHSYAVPEGYMVIGAGNTFEDRADIIALPAPLEQRFSIFRLDPPGIDDWIVWASEHSIDARIIAYLKRFPDKLFRFDADLEMTGQPIPRQWEHLSQLIDGEKDMEFVKALAVGRVGEPAAIEFVNFLRLSEDIDMDAIFDGREPIPKSVDLAYSVMAGLLNLFRRDPEKNFDRAMNIAKEYEKEHSPEFAALWLRLIKYSIPTERSERLFLRSAEGMRWLERYARYFAEE
jgi:hypothetical protein